MRSLLSARARPRCSELFNLMKCKINLDKHQIAVQLCPKVVGLVEKLFTRVNLSKPEFKIFLVCLFFLHFPSPQVMKEQRSLSDTSILDCV